MKWVGRILALAAFAAIMAYGVTRFIAAAEVRRLMADAELACEAHGGVQEMEVLASGAARVMCADGTRPAMAGNAQPAGRAQGETE